MSDANLSPFTNQLLAALPAEDLQRLAPHLKYVHMPLHQVLYEQGAAVTQVFFPEKSMISLVSVLRSRRIEVGVVGLEGMVSTSSFMGGGVSPFETMIQVENGAWRLAVGILQEEFDRGGALQKLLLNYAQSLYIQVSQTAACNQLHSLDERLARWLLMTHDRAQRDLLELKQEFLSMMLGVERSRVTLAAITLQEAEIIKYRRGKIAILSRSELERASCECYAIAKTLTRPLLGQ